MSHSLICARIKQKRSKLTKQRVRFHELISRCGSNGSETFILHLVGGESVYLNNVISNQCCTTEASYLETN